MEFTFQVPGKTFLLGEYAVLRSAPALIMCHEPSYRFRVSHRARAGLTELQRFFHPQSPAGYLVQHSALQGAQVFISCEHQYGEGGFGLSTAEFWVAHQLLSLIDRSGSHEFLAGASLPLDVDHLSLIQSYWRVFDHQNQSRPSGADLQAQSKGGFCYIDQKQSVLQTIRWPFPELSVCVVPTGKKLKTHEHLQKMQQVDFGDLVQISEMIAGVFQQEKPELLIDLVQQYGRLLQEKGLVADHTQEMMRDLQTLPGVLATKGCGAMGADSMLAIVRFSEKEMFLRQLFEKSWRVYDHLGQGGFIA